jgi:hydroxyacylglutathione hydrolase
VSNPEPAHENTGPSQVIEVLPGVWQVRQDLAPIQTGIYTVAHVLVGEHILILDTGIPNREASILDLLTRLGRSPQDVSAILNTHGHVDHIGSNVALAEATGAPVLLHRDDRFYLDGARQLWGEAPVLTKPADTLLSDGNVLTFGDHRLEVVHLPGHSAGSAGYYDRKRRVLYCGDAVQGRGSFVQHLPLYYDPDAYERSLRRVAQLAIDHLVPAHPYLPLGESLVSGADAVRSYLELSLEVYEKIEAQIRDVVRAADRPLTVDEITLPLCVQNGFPTTTAMATTTVRAHLERLKRRRTVAMKNVGGRLIWMLA